MNNHDSHQRNRYSTIKNHASPKKIFLFLRVIQLTNKGKDRFCTACFLYDIGGTFLVCSLFFQKNHDDSSYYDKGTPCIGDTEVPGHLHKKEQKLSLVTNRYGTLKKQYILEE